MTFVSYWQRSPGVDGLSAHADTGSKLPVAAVGLRAFESHSTIASHNGILEYFIE